MSTENQESRTMTVSARVTPREKHAMEFVAGMLGTDVSNLLRIMSVEEILAKREKLASGIPNGQAA